MGDPVMIRQVYANLISNAWKFTRNIQQAVIEIGARQNGEEVIYYVKDNGAGFDMKYASSSSASFSCRLATPFLE